ncbi:hypothetical protein [Streptomyces sp. NPDC013455]|uniref:hypothetical protein n=1 Tax=Streptomyces sp. NPDC013455 TaxID=3155605 RepID=UPI0033DD1740
MSDFDSLPFGDARRRADLRPRLIYAAVRRNYAELPFADVMTFTSGAALLAACAASLYFAGVRPDGAVQGLLAAVCAGLGVTLVLIVLFRFSRGDTRVYLLSHLLLATSVQIIAASAALWFGSPYLGGRPSYARSAVDGLALGLVVAGCWVWFMTLLAYLVSYSRRRTRRTHRYDAALLRWVDATALVWFHRGRIHHPKVSTMCAVSIERAARSAESAARSSDVLHLLEPHQKAEIRTESLRISEVFRAHKAALLRIGNHDDLDRLVESMLAGVEALATGDREALLANAPEEIPRSNRIRRFFLWVLPPALLISAGILLPLIPAISSNAAAQSLRWSLVVAGVLSLVAAQKDVATRINDTFGKAITWK